MAAAATSSNQPLFLVPTANAAGSGHPHISSSASSSRCSRGMTACAVFISFSPSTSTSSVDGYGGPSSTTISNSSPSPSRLPCHSSSSPCVAPPRLSHRRHQQLNATCPSKSRPFDPLHPSRNFRLWLSSSSSSSSSSGRAAPCFSPVPRASGEWESGGGSSPQQPAKGFGPLPKQRNLSSSGKGGEGGGGGGASDIRRQKDRRAEDDSDDANNNCMFGSANDDTIPEVVSSRMMSRLGVTVGIPMFIGFAFFPFFYYLKVIKHLDIPTWLPFVMSGFTFGTAGLGISYGILSTSWDPYQEGTLLGWKELRENWPVFLRSFGGEKESK